MRGPVQLIRTLRELRARAERQHKRIARVETELGGLLPRLTAIEARLTALEDRGSGAGH